MKNRYAFIFKTDRYWIIVCYEIEKKKHMFNWDEHILEESEQFVEDFLKDGGNKYLYNMSMKEFLVRIIEDNSLLSIDFFSLKDEPIKGFSEFLVAF